MTLPLHPYRLSNGDIVDEQGRRVTVSGNLGICQLLNEIHELHAKLRAIRPEGGERLPAEAKLRRLMDEVRANGHMMSNGEILNLCCDWLREGCAK